MCAPVHVVVDAYDVAAGIDVDSFRMRRARIVDQAENPVRQNEPMRRQGFVVREYTDHVAFVVNTRWQHLASGDIDDRKSPVQKHEAMLGIVGCDIVAGNLAAVIDVSYNGV